MTRTYVVNLSCMSNSSTDTLCKILSSDDAEPDTPKKQEDSILVTDEFKLRDEDICCGRGKGYWKNPGNKMFHHLIRENAHTYSECPTKDKKSHLVTSIVEGIRKTGSRFVKEDKDNAGHWIELDETLSREKTSHAIRDHLLYKSKQQTKEPAGKKKKELKKKTMKMGVKRSREIHHRPPTSDAKDGRYPRTTSAREQCHQATMPLDPGYPFTDTNGSSIHPIPLKMIDGSFVEDSLYPDITTSGGRSSAMDISIDISLYRRSFAEDAHNLSREDILEVCDLLMQEQDETGNHDRSAMSSGDTIICEEGGPIFPSDWI
jgi:hypothetical protein